jgi:hypothetical protein
MIRILITYSILVFCLRISAFLASGPVVPRSQGMGNCGAALDNGAESALLNPAVCAFSRRGDVFCAYSRLFGVSGLNSFSLGSVIPVREHCVSAGLYAQTFENIYTEGEAVVSYSYVLKEKLSLGAGINGLALHFNDKENVYGSAVVPSASLFSGFRFSQNIMLGCTWYHVVSPEVGGYGDQIPSTASCGLAYKYGELYRGSFDLTKEMDFPVSLKMGQEISLWKHLCMRAGLCTKPLRLSMGLGLNWKRYSFDYSYTSHAYLGGTHYIALAYEFKIPAQDRPGKDDQPGTGPQRRPTIIYEE